MIDIKQNVFSSANNTRERKKTEMWIPRKVIPYDLSIRKHDCFSMCKNRFLEERSISWIRKTLVSRYLNNSIASLLNGNITI